MRRLLILAALPIFSPALFAQTPATPTNFTIVSGEGCPVALTAQPRAPYTIVETGKPSPQPSHGYLYLHFFPDTDAAKARSIVAATIVLHGTDTTPRADLVATNQPSDLTESFNLSNGANPLRDSQIAPKSVANVRWLSIAELRYADGTTWHPSDTAFCHVTPNGFQLIDATAK